MFSHWSNRQNGSRHLILGSSPALRGLLCTTASLATDKTLSMHLISSYWERGPLEQRPRFHLLAHSRFDDPYFSQIPERERILTICPDSVLDSLSVRCARFQFTLPPLGFSQLSTSTLRTTWDEIAKLAGPAESLRPANQTFVSFDDAPTEIPTSFLRYQLADGPVEESSRTGLERVEDFLYRVTLLSAMAALEDEVDTIDEAEARLPQAFRSAQTRTRVPVVLASPGVSSSEAKNRRPPPRLRPH